jgi:acyl-CoA thioesterase
LSADRPHPFDLATRVTAEGGRRQGRTSDAYWAFVGPFGGATAATILRAVLEHEERSGDPLALTVNYCAPVARGAFDLDVRLARANRSSQHWTVEIHQGAEGAVATATIVLAERRPSWSHQPSAPPDVPPAESLESFPNKTASSWVGQYDFRFARGAPRFSDAPDAPPESPLSHLWLADTEPRRIDMLSLAAMADAFFGRIFHVRGGLVPFGTVSLTTYFHADAAELADEDTHRLLGVADARIFHKSYGDQSVELWSPRGRLLATSQQMAYFKA